MNICKGSCDKYRFKRLIGSAFIYYDGKAKYCRCCEMFLCLSDPCERYCPCCKGKLRFSPALSYYKRGYEKINK